MNITALTDALRDTAETLEADEAKVVQTRRRHVSLATAINILTVAAEQDALGVSIDDHEFDLIEWSEEANENNMFGFCFDPHSSHLNPTDFPTFEGVLLPDGRIDCGFITAYPDETYGPHTFRTLREWAEGIAANTQP